MPFEQPHQDPNQLKGSAENQEKGPETVDPAAMAKERIAKAERVASIDRRQLNDISRLEQAIDSKPRKEMSEKQILDKTRLDTLSIISDRISRMQATLHTDKEAMKQTTWGQRFDSTFKLGGLLGQTSRGAEAEGIRLQDEALTKMKALHATVLEIQDLKTLKATRIQLGLAELPQDLVGDYDQYEAMRLKGAAKKDKSLEVDWLAINEQLKTAEAVLDRWETAIQIADTGMGIAAGLVPGGSEVYEIAHALTDVAVGTKTPDQAARDFAFGVLASRVGGKALKKMNVDEIAGTWAKKNAKYFSKKTAESLSKVAGKTAAGATQGAISGATEGTMHGTYNVATGKATVEQALSDTASRATIGAVFGGVMGGGMEGMKIRGEFKTARQKAELKNNIMRLPDADRPQAAEIVLGHPLTDVQKKAVLAAHDVPMKDGQKYSPAELMQKMRILEASGVSRTDADQLLRMGVCGAPPPPPVPKPKNTPTTQPVSGPMFLPKKPLPPPPSKMTRENLLGEYKRDIAVNQSAIASLDTELVRLNAEYKTLNEKLRDPKTAQPERNALYTKRDAITRRAEAIEKQTANHRENIKRYEKESSRTPAEEKTSPKKSASVTPQEKLQRVDDLVGSKVLEQAKAGRTFSDIRDDISRMNYLDLVGAEELFKKEAARMNETAKKLFPNETPLDLGTRAKTNAHVFELTHDPQLAGTPMNKTIADHQAGGYQLQYGKGIGDRSEAKTTFYLNPRNARLKDVIGALDKSLADCNAQIKISCDNISSGDPEKVIVYFNTKNREDINRFIRNIAGSKEILDGSLNPLDSNIVPRFKIPIGSGISFVERPTGDSWDANISKLFQGNYQVMLGMVQNRNNKDPRIWKGLFNFFNVSRNRSIPGLQREVPSSSQPTLTTQPTSTPTFLPKKPLPPPPVLKPKNAPEPKPANDVNEAAIKKPADTSDDDELIDFKIIRPKYEGVSNNLEKARTYLQDFNPETTPTKPDEFLFSLTNGKRLDQAVILPVNNQRVLVADIPQSEFNGGQMILIPEKEGAQLVSFDYANCMILSCVAVKNNQRYIGLAHISVGSWETNINKALDTIAGAGFTFESFAISPRKDRLMKDVEKHLERLKTNPRPIMKEIRGTNEDLRTINGAKSTNETYASYSAAIVEHTGGKTRLTFDIGEKPDPSGVAPVIITQKQIEFVQTK